MSAFNNRPKQTLSAVAALTSSALSLPGYSPAVQADAPPEKARLSYRFSQYQEDDLPSSELAAGDRERYEIDVHQTRFEASLGERFSIAVNWQREIMSGASPWLVLPGVGSQPSPSITMSGASIREDRTDVSTEIAYYYDLGQLGLSYAESDENDYESSAWGLSAQRDFNDKHTRVTLSLSRSEDDISPSTGFVPVLFDEGEKHSNSVFAGVSQVINRYALLRAGIGFTSTKGDLSDPYKGGDRRPGKRFQRTFSLGYKHFIPKLQAAVALDYRYFTDSWDIDSDTVDLSWNQRITPSWHITPSIRYYRQEEADFFTNDSLLLSLEQHASADYRLSKFDAITYGIDSSIDIGDWRLVVGAKWYDSDPSGSDRQDHSAALVDFKVYTVGFDYSFDW